MKNEIILKKKVTMIAQLLLFLVKNNWDWVWMKTTIL